MSGASLLSFSKCTRRKKKKNNWQLAALPAADAFLKSTTHMKKSNSRNNRSANVTALSLLGRYKLPLTTWLSAIVSPHCCVDVFFFLLFFDKLQYKGEKKPKHKNEESWFLSQPRWPHTTATDGVNGRNKAEFFETRQLLLVTQKKRKVKKRIYPHQHVLLGFCQHEIIHIYNNI